MKRVSLLWLAVLVAACGGAEQSSLLEDSGTSGGQDGSVKPDTGGGGPDSGPSKDATVDSPPVEDVVTVDVPVGPADSKIHCGPSLTCSAQKEVCCATAGTTSFTYACVGSLGDCSGQDQVAITCSSPENCASQGSPGDVCCGSPGGPQNPNVQCGQFSSASGTACQTSCDPQQQQFEVGCSTQQQNCTDPQQTCITSQCTLPGYNICH